MLSGNLLPSNRGSQTTRASDLIGDHMLVGTAQTKRVSVLIGSQLMGTAQIKRAWLRDGSHAIDGNEVIFIDPHKRIHGDEHDVCV